jgi:hypothetical protein
LSIRAVATTPPSCTPPSSHNHSSLAGSCALVVDPVVPAGSPLGTTTPCTRRHTPCTGTPALTLGAPLLARTHPPLEPACVRVAAGRAPRSRVGHGLRSTLCRARPVMGSDSGVQRKWTKRGATTMWTRDGLQGGYLIYIYCIYIMHLGAFSIANAPRPN